MAAEFEGALADLARKTTSTEGGPAARGVMRLRLDIDLQALAELARLGLVEVGPDSDDPTEEP